MVPRARTTVGVALLVAAALAAPAGAAGGPPEVSPPVAAVSPSVAGGGTACSELKPAGWQRAPTVQRINAMAATFRKAWCSDGTWCYEHPKSPHLTPHRFFAQKWDCHFRNHVFVTCERLEPFGGLAPWESLALDCNGYQVAVSGRADVCGKQVLKANHYPILAVHGFSGSARSWDADRRAPYNDRLAYLEPGGVLDGEGTQWETRIVPPFEYGDASLKWVTDPAIGQALAERIACIAEESKRVGGPGVVILVTHGSGGLAARQATAISVGGRPVADRVGLVVTAGAPHLGSFLAPDSGRHLVTCIGGAIDALTARSGAPPGPRWKDCVAATGYDAGLELVRGDGVDPPRGGAAALQIASGVIAAGIARSSVVMCNPFSRAAMFAGGVTGTAFGFTTLNPIVTWLSVQVIKLALYGADRICAWSPLYDAPAVRAMAFGSEELRALPPWRGRPDVYSIAGRIQVDWPEIAGLLADFGLFKFFKYLKSVPVRYAEEKTAQASLDVWDALGSLAFGEAFTEAVRKEGGEPDDFGFGDFVVGIGSALRHGSFGRFVATCKAVDLGDVVTSPCFHENLMDHPEVRDRTADAVRRWIEKELRAKDPGVAVDEVSDKVAPFVGWWRAERVIEPEGGPSHDTEAELMRSLGLTPGVYQLAPTDAKHVLRGSFAGGGGPMACRRAGDELFTLGAAGEDLVGSIEPVDDVTCDPLDPDREQVEAEWRKISDDELELCWGGLETVYFFKRACVRLTRSDAAGGRPNG